MKDEQWEWFQESFENLNRRITQLERLIIYTLRIGRQDMGTLDDSIKQLTQDVSDLTTVDQSAEALINGFAAQLAAAVAAAQAAGATPAQLQSLTDLHAAIDAQDTALAQAVLANTPATPAPAPSPAPASGGGTGVSPAPTPSTPGTPAA